MSEASIVFIIIASIIGGYCIGRLWGLKEVLEWRLRWIELEHESARKEEREPRNIDELFGEKK